MATSESKVQASIVRYLKSLGSDCWYVKTITSNARGVPDLIVCYNGFFFAFEVKSETGRASVLQEYNLEKIQNAGGRCCIVRSVNDVKEMLQGIEK